MKRVSFLAALLTALMGASYLGLRLGTDNDWLAIFLTLAMITVGPTLIYFLLVRPRAMPRLWGYLSFLACLGAAYLIIPSSQKAYFNTLLFGLLPVIEISVVLIVVYGIVKSVRTYRSVQAGEKLGFLEVVENALEPKLGNGFILHAVITELSVFYYSLVVWFKKPSVSANDTFTYHKDSQIRTIVILFSVLIVIEGVLFHFLLQRWSEVVAWIFTVLNAYGLLYIIGLYNSVKFLPHVIGENYLIIRLGYQSSIKVDIHNIERTQVAQAYSITDKLSKDTYYSLLSIDSPQYEIILKEPEVMKGSYGKKTYVNSVVLRADDSKGLMETIENLHMSNSNNIGQGKL